MKRILWVALLALLALAMVLLVRAWQATPVVVEVERIAPTLDAAAMAARLAAEPPIHEPGRAHIYHALTIGWITSELVRRVTGKPLGLWLEQEISGPLELNLCIGNAGSRVRDIATLLTPPQVQVQRARRICRRPMRSCKQQPDRFPCR